MAGKYFKQFRVGQTFIHDERGTGVALTNNLARSRAFRPA
jgi:hypothetical protein